MRETALIIVNMQQVRADKTSEYYLGDLSQMIEKINNLIAYARAMNYKIIFIRHVEVNSDFDSSNPLSQLLNDLDYHSELDTVIVKNKISAFYQTNLETELEGIKNLVVCWVLTNLCVRMLVEEAYDRDFRVALIDDLTATFTSELQEMTFEDLYTTRSGISILPLAKFVE